MKCLQCGKLIGENAFMGNFCSLKCADRHKFGSEWVLSASTFKAPMSQQIGGNHYKEQAIQVVEFCQRNGLNWCESNAVKYVCRHKSKNGRQDIEKAIHYLQMLLEIEYGEGK